MENVSLCLATQADGKSCILHSIHTTQANGIPVKVIFVRNRNKKSDWSPS